MPTGIQISLSKIGLHRSATKQQKEKNQKEPIHKKSEQNEIKKKKRQMILHICRTQFINCRNEATRTPDPYVPNVVRYQLRYFPIADAKLVRSFGMGGRFGGDFTKNEGKSLIF